ncbi:MAG: ATP-binding protein [Candidatus Nomurabacteria bacterium]|jgi:predicted kinase|nr:ATP-binding protein [Candidatus Nomurabacteria bacterium]
MAKPQFLIIAGPIGSGKSSFAEQFSVLFKAPAVDVEAIRYDLKRKPDYSEVEGKLAHKVALIMLRTFMTSGYPLLAVGGETFAERQKWRSMAERAGYQTTVVWLQVDKPTLKRRFAERMKDEKLAPDVFISAMKEVELPEPQEKVVYVSGKHIFSTQVRSVLEKLASK